MNHQCLLTANLSKQAQKFILLHRNTRRFIIIFDPEATLANYRFSFKSLLRSVSWFTLIPALQTNPAATATESVLI
ncbi:hypothetical protein D3C75_943440 [compost metagenome]